MQRLELLDDEGLWIDDNGVTWLAADFPDGGMLVSADPESEIVTRDVDLALAVIAERTDAMAFEGWAGCGVSVVVAAGACASTLGWGWLLCGVGAANATCECIKAANNGKAKYPCGKEKQKEKGK